MKKSLILLGVLSMATAYAQEGRVGINTENPNATLEVAGVPTNTKVLDGIIAPRITGDQLKAKTYTANQTGALVYVTEPATTANQTGQTINVAGAGYYYFDGSVWQIFKAGDTDTQYTAGTGIAISDDNVISRTGLEQVGDDNFRLIGVNDYEMQGNTIDLRVSKDFEYAYSYDDPLYGESTYNEKKDFLPKGNIAIGKNLGSFAENMILIGKNNYSEINNSIIIGENNGMFAKRYYSGEIEPRVENYEYADNVILGRNNIVENVSGTFIQGNGNKAYNEADNAAVFGLNNVAFHMGELVAGTYSYSPYYDYGDSPNGDPLSPRTMDYTRPLFRVGNGTSEENRSNAIIVVRDASTGIGIVDEEPTEKLDVNGNVRVRGENKAIEEGATCLNEGTITYSNQSFYGCAGNVWKKLHN